MHPELFKLPFTDLTVKSYGVMMVIGFFFAAFVVKKMCKRVNFDHNEILNAAFYTFLVGIVGARVFHVIHYIDNFDSFGSMLAIWQGGLEFLGGVVPAILFLIIYLYLKRLKIAAVLDILATALMIGAAFGRIGCFLNGCCFGLPTDCASGVVFPYNSIPYQSQAYPDQSRNREKAIIDLPADYYGWYSSPEKKYIANEQNKYDNLLLPYEALTDEQKEEVRKGGKYCALAIHPTQLYDSAAMFGIFGVLIWLWARFGSGQLHPSLKKLADGSIGAIMLILYSLSRFSIEFLRGDNPYEAAIFTVSQLLSIGLFVCGIIMFAFLNQRRCKRS